MNKLVVLFLLATLMAGTTFPHAAHAGSATGKIKQVIVGRLQHEVYIEVGAPISDFACSSTHSAGLNFAFSLNRPDGQALLSTIITAYSTDLDVLVVGTESCTIDPTVETVNYLWLSKP